MFYQSCIALTVFLGLRDQVDGITFVTCMCDSGHQSHTSGPKGPPSTPITVMSLCGISVIRFFEVGQMVGPGGSEVIGQHTWVIGHVIGQVNKLTW